MSRRRLTAAVLIVYVALHLPTSVLWFALGLLSLGSIGGLDWLDVIVTLAAMVLSVSMLGLLLGVRGGADWVPDQGPPFAVAFAVLHGAILLLFAQDNLEFAWTFLAAVVMGVAFIATDLWLREALRRMDVGSTGT